MANTKPLTHLSFPSNWGSTELLAHLNTGIAGLLAVVWRGAFVLCHLHREREKNIPQEAAQVAPLSNRISKIYYLS